MKTLYILLATLFTIVLNAQDPCSKSFQGKSANVKFTEDVVKGDVRLYILGGFAPAITKADRKFEEKYKVRFHDFGCTPPPLDYYKEYNVLAFAYLKEKYGEAWEKEIRPNILGWDLWKKK